MKNLKIIAISLVLAISACKKETKDTNEIIIGDTLSETDNDYIDSVSVSNPSLHDMIGLDGNPLGRLSGTQTSLNDLVKALLIDAQQLSAQKSINHPDEGTNKPQHMGLVYSYGQRDITIRLNPNAGNAIHKKYAVYGTDCSGFIINLLKHAGINIPNCTVSSFESTLKNALKNNPDSIKIENKGHLSINEIKTGDIIFWLGADLNHIGIISELINGKRVVFQSNGTGTPMDESAQTKNLGIKRGVHAIDLSMAINGRGYWGNSYKILRLKTNDSTVQDIDGNIYHIVKIGTQTWMVENLRTTRLNDGATIPINNDSLSWANSTGSRFCYPNFSATSPVEYGAIYSQEVAKNSKIAPAGWHVPTLNDMFILGQYLGGTQNSYLDYYFFNNVCLQICSEDVAPGFATNTTGFSAKEFECLRAPNSWNLGTGCFWTNTIGPNNTQRYVEMTINKTSGANSLFIRGGYPLSYGLPIRLVKD